MMPRYFCWAWKYFWERFTTLVMRNRETGRITKAMRVISGLMVSIITTTPINVVMLVISWVTL